MNNRLIIEEDANTSNLSTLTKKEKISKKNKIKVEVRYSNDRNRTVRAIVDIDPEAEIFLKDFWTFKIKSNLTLSQINRILAAHDIDGQAKKTLFI